MRHTGNLAETWRKFKFRLQFYFEGKYSKASLTNDRKIGILIIALGEKGIDMYDSFQLETKPTYEDLLKLFDAYYAPRKNTVYERFKFNQIIQQPGQGVADFLLALRTQANPCEFDITEASNLVYDHFVVGLTDAKLCLELLRVSDLTLDKAADLARVYEASSMQSAVMSTNYTATPSNASTLSTTAQAIALDDVKASNSKLTLGTIEHATVAEMTIGPGTYAQLLIKHVVFVTSKGTLRRYVNKNNETNRIQ